MKTKMDKTMAHKIILGFNYRKFKVWLKKSFKKLIRRINK